MSLGVFTLLIVCLIFRLSLLDAFVFISKTIYASSSLQKLNLAKKESMNEPAGAESSPRRVQAGTGISVRRQIAHAKAYKRLMTYKSFAKNGLGKKFRQGKAPKKEEKEYVEIDYESVRPPAVFVDGYNVISYLNVIEGRDLSLEDGRDSLINDLAILSGVTGWYIEVVFDAYKGDRSGSFSRSKSANGIIATYTGRSETADNYIERRFSELSKNNFNNMIVATDDKLLRSVAGSVGNGFLSLGMLVEEIRIAYSGWERMEADMKEEMKRHRPRINCSLTDEVTMAIETLRKRKVELKLEEELKPKHKIENIEKNREDRNVQKNKAKGKLRTNNKLKRDSQRPSTIAVSSRGKGFDAAFTPSLGLSVSSEIMDVMRQLEQFEKKK